MQNGHYQGEIRVDLPDDPNHSIFGKNAHMFSHPMICSFVQDQEVVMLVDRIVYHLGVDNTILVMVRI